MSQTAIADAPFMWAPGATWTRFTVVAFRRELHLKATPKAATISVFAHSHYRLHVNGVHVAAGPARSHPDHPSYDVVDLKPYLHAGDNVIAVLVAHTGSYSFHHVPRPGCFVAAGDIDGVNLSTASNWRCCISRGHAEDAPRWSFAIPMVEICDERTWPRGWDRVGTPAGEWTTPELIDRTSWGALSEAGIPQLTHDESRLSRIVRAYRHADGEQIIGFRLHQDRDITRIDYPQATAVAHTWIHSDEARSVVMGTWWGEHGLNGQALAQAPEKPGIPMRTDTVLALRPGWNLLLIRYGVIFGYWECQVALPADLRIDASRGSAKLPIAMRSAGPFPTADFNARWSGFPNDETSLAAISADWRDHDFTSVPASPQRHLAWARPAEVITIDQGRPFPLRIRGSRGASLVCDFGRVVLGRVRVRVHAPAGTHLDFAYSEELREGRPYYHKASIINAADRRVVGDSGELTTYFRRGFRYLEVGIAGHETEVILDDISVIEERYPYEREGSFTCSDQRLSTLWEYCRETLRNCSEDVITDCPWRERTMYGGDLFVETGVTAVISSDLRLVKRAITVYLQCANNDGGVGGRAPSVGGSTSEGEFQLMVLLSACWYGRLSNDLTTMKQWLPHLRGIMSTVTGVDEATGLHVFRSSFIEHVNVQKKGLVTAANSILAGSWRAFAGFLNACGEDSSDAKRRADALATAVCTQLWDAKAEAFHTGIGDPEAAGDHHQLHASFHAGAWDCTDATQDRVMLTTIRNRLRALAADPTLRGDKHLGRRDQAFSAYGAFYMLMYLARCEATDLAEEIISTWYADMLEHPTGTVWEQFHSDCSLNHAWAAAPAWYASTQILGVQIGPALDTALDRVVIAPQATGITWAEGTVPHPLGAVFVRWDIRGDVLMLRHRCPPGVTVEVRPRGPLATLRLVVEAVHSATSLQVSA